MRRKRFKWPKWPKWLTGLLVFAIAIAVAGFGAILILGFAGIGPLATCVGAQGLRKLPDPAKGSVIAGAITGSVTWVAGVFALYTFFLTYTQKREHHEKEEKRERDLAELQRIEAEFAAYAKDFAQPEPLARINAAIGLGELARKPDPRRVIDGPGPEEDREYYKRITTRAGERITILETPREWPSEWRTPKTETNYPYFMRAANRLAAALHQWDDEPSRNQAFRVLIEMGAWAKDAGTDEPLLHALANALADAHRMSWQLLCNRAAKCLAMKMDSNMVASLAGIGNRPRFIDTNEEWTLAVTHYLSFLAAGLAKLPELITPLPANSVDQSELRDQLYVAGQGHKASRDALSACLRQLSQPPELRWPGDKAVKLAEELRRRRKLNLKRIVVTSAVLGAARLEAADLRDARFIASDCEVAHFDAADCTNASFYLSQLSAASFYGADCLVAQFIESKCQSTSFMQANCQEARFSTSNCNFAIFQDANCPMASFAKSKCIYARFNRAGCVEADFQGTDARFAQFEGAFLYGVIIDDDTNMESANWFDASFLEPLSEEPDLEYDAMLWQELNARHPADPPRNPPWEKPADAAENSSGDAGAEKEASTEIKSDQPTPSDPEPQPIDPDSTQKDDE